MSVLSYTAKNRIIAGHTVDTLYNLEFYLSKDDFMGDVFYKDYISLNGTREVIKQNREDDNFNFTVTAIDISKLPDWNEFYYSVVQGAVFTFDRLGSIAVPVDPITCVMTSKKLNEQRASGLNEFKINFAVRRNV